MILIGFGKYPAQSAKEVAKRFTEIPRIPDYIKSKGNYVYATEDGLVGLTIYEFDSAKAEEAIEQINSGYWKFYDIPGFRYKLVPCAKARDTAVRFLEVT